jgi:hypothetical protein
VHKLCDGDVRLVGELIQLHKLRRGKILNVDRLERFVDMPRLHSGPLRFHGRNFSVFELPRRNALDSERIFCFVVVQ